ncbi:MAG TPA: acyl carrier protein [Candidatus Binatia bacterium]|nr:acyl carrier protein [Candidatus Binatia bacterium]
MPTHDQTYAHVRSLLIDLFEVEPEKIRPDARLAQDLEIDSIDAIDLVLKLKDYCGRKIKPEEFKHVLTVGDVVNAVQSIVSAAA